MAGRLGAAVTVSLDKVGRAFVNPFFAQAYDPSKWVTPQLHNASSWWIKFLTARPPASFDIKGTRPTIRMWTDASGASRTLAAVVAVMSESGVNWFWTRMVVPFCIWEQLLDRHDDQIGFQEFLAFALGYEAFGIHDTLLISYIDNDGVLKAIIKGSARPPEVNLAIGKVWLDMATKHNALFAARVESKANVADGPSRDDLALINGLNAKYMTPILPSWAWDLWCWPA